MKNLGNGKSLEDFKYIAGINQTGFRKKKITSGPVWTTDETGASWQGELKYVSPTQSCDYEDGEQWTKKDLVWRVNDCVGGTNNKTCCQGWWRGWEKIGS